MHLVNILRIITFSFLVGHSILTISDFNSFRFFWDFNTLTKVDNMRKSALQSAAPEDEHSQILKHCRHAYEKRGCF